MNKTAKLLVGLVAVIVIAGGGYLLFFSGDKNTETTSTTPAGQNNEAGHNQASDKTPAVTITYSDSGFSPDKATVASGDAVKVVNSTGSEMEFASNPHPVHTDNPELNTGDIAPGQSKTITVTTKGVWGFHNHYKPTDGGKLTVQ